MGKLRLSIAIADHPVTRALKDGSVRIEGVDMDFIDVRPQIAAFRRMIRNQEFDICEIAATTYLIARSFRYPLAALPVFLHRAFHHGAFLVRPDADVVQPKDLEGKKVGVRAYSVTTGVWARGVLAEQFGVDLSKVTWVVDDEEHVLELELPPNVVHVPAGQSLAALMASGELQAGLAGDAGIGRTGSPQSGWNAFNDPATRTYRPLILDADERAREWYQGTHIYPMHGVVVLKEALVCEHPWLAEAVTRAFQASKEIWFDRWRTGADDDARDRSYRTFSHFVGEDPLPYGVDANKPTLDALQRMAVQQGLLCAPLPLEYLFAAVSTSIFARTL